MTHPQAPATAPKSKRTVCAPQSDVAAGVALSVELAEDEEVTWQWSHGADGRSRITGYQIHKRPSGPAQ
jgi:hypothetical protein